MLLQEPLQKEHLHRLRPHSGYRRFVPHLRIGHVPRWLGQRQSARLLRPKRRRFRSRSMRSRMGLLHCRRVDAAHLRLFDAFRSSGNLNVERRRSRRNSQGQDPHLSAMRIDIIIIENKETCSEAYISSEKKQPKRSNRNRRPLIKTKTMRRSEKKTQAPTLRGIDLLFDFASIAKMKREITF